MTGGLGGFCSTARGAGEQMPLHELLRGRARPAFSCAISRSGWVCCCARPGALAYVDPAAVPAGDRRHRFSSPAEDQGTADAAVVIRDGFGPLMLKMYNPEEQVPISATRASPRLLRVGMPAFLP